MPDAHICRKWAVADSNKAEKVDGSLMYRETCKECGRERYVSAFADWTLRDQVSYQRLGSDGMREALMLAGESRMSGFKKRMKKGEA